MTTEYKGMNYWTYAGVMIYLGLIAYNTIHLKEVVQSSAITICLFLFVVGASREQQLAQGDVA